MKKEVFFVANWKMYLNFNDTLDYAAEHYDELVSLANTPHKKIIICPSATALYTLTNIFKDTPVHFGAQDCSEHNRGAFTGQISAQDLKSIGCRYCIIGHSELRHYKYETHTAIAKKFQHLIDHEITPILCIGENKIEYDQGFVFEVLKSQLKEIFSMVNQKKHNAEKFSIYIAYEPVWSIGSGNIPSKNHLQNVFAWLDTECNKINQEIQWKFLYGGSVKGETMHLFENISHLNGYLIGSASLDFQEFKKIVCYQSHDLVAETH